MAAHREKPLVAVPDALLLRRFYEGDEASFEALFLRHYDMIYGVLYRLTGVRHTAEDLAQEVFLKLYHRSLRHEDNVAGWLYRVAINTGYNALRSSYRQSRREQVAGRLDSPHTPLTEEEVTRRETQRRVREALARIPARSARLLILRQSGFSYEEIAEVIGVAPGSVGTLLARAQRDFRKAFGDEESEDVSSA